MHTYIQKQQFYTIVDKIQDTSEYSIKQ